MRGDVVAWALGQTLLDIEFDRAMENIRGGLPGGEWLCDWVNFGRAREGGEFCRWGGEDGRS